jgi:hypothetical protein
MAIRSTAIALTIELAGSGRGVYETVEPLVNWPRHPMARSQRESETPNTYGQNHR